MTDDLRNTLDELLHTGSDSNPALNELLLDYASYHKAFIGVGGVFLAAFAVLAVFSWRRFTRTPTHEERRWSFERVTFLLFAERRLPPTQQRRQRRLDAP